MQNEPEKLDLTVPPPAGRRDDLQPPAPYGNEPVPEFEDSVDIRDYLDVIARRKWLILAVLLTSIITTLVLSLVMKPLYRAAGKIELTFQSPRVTKFEEMTAALAMPDFRN